LFKILLKLFYLIEGKWTKKFEKIG
jgi:hypothetical protein